MSIGFYDFDIELKPNKLMLNLEAMKIAAYYNNLGQVITLTNDLRDYSKYDEFYVCRNVLPKNVEREKAIRTIQADNVHHIGLAYSNGIYIPMEQKF